MIFVLQVFRVRHFHLPVSVWDLMMTTRDCAGVHNKDDVKRIPDDIQRCNNVEEAEETIIETARKALDWENVLKR